MTERPAAASAGRVRRRRAHDACARPVGARARMSSSAFSRKAAGLVTGSARRSAVRGDCFAERGEIGMKGRNERAQGPAEKAACFGHASGALQTRRRGERRRPSGLRRTAAGFAPQCGVTNQDRGRGACRRADRQWPEKKQNASSWLPPNDGFIGWSSSSAPERGCVRECRRLRRAPQSFVQCGRQQKSASASFDGRKGEALEASAKTVWALVPKSDETALCLALLRRDLLKPAHRVSSVLRQQSVSLG